MTETVYVRNLRPNRVVLLHAGLRVTLERRGSREDTTSLPADALNEPTIARWLRASMIEEISKEDFMNLAARTDAFDPNFRSPEEPELVSNVKTKAVPMSPERSETPYLIDTDKLDKRNLTPIVEFKDPPTPTSDDISPQQVSIHELHRGETGRPANLSKADEFASEEVVAENVAKPKPRRKPTARKKPAAPRKSTKN